MTDAPEQKFNFVYSKMLKNTMFGALHNFASCCFKFTVVSNFMAIEFGYKVGVCDSKTIWSRSTIWQDATFYLYIIGRFMGFLIWI